MNHPIANAVTIAVLLLTLSVRCVGEDLHNEEPLDDQTLAERKADAEQTFRTQVKPFIKSFCLDCHQNARPTEAGLSFTPALDAPGDAAFSEKWKKAAARVKAHDMPPEGLEQPSDDERQMFVDWTEQLKYLSDKDPGPFIIRRLTKTEYGNTLRDLVGVDPSVAHALPDEVSGAGYLNSLSPLQLEKYLAIADEVLKQVASGDTDAASNLSRQLADTANASGDDNRQLALSTAKTWSTRAFRRPVSPSELDVLMNIYDLGRQKELPHADALRLMMKAMLVSPQFLFITPATKPSTDEKIVPLDDYQLASRLSYFLWATMPDQELMKLADSGKLHEKATLEAQVKRMIADPRSRALFDGFGAQWLGVGDLASKTFDLEKFPEMDDELRAAMYDEARLFFENVMRQNHSVMHLIQSDYTFLNQRLASIYDVDVEVIGPKLRKVPLTNSNRGGILGMPGVLAATSFPNRTSPVIRGVWVLEQVLGEHVPPAPPDVPALESQDQQSVANLSLRERTQLHRTDPVCANCHQLLDPIGFGLENFNAIGRWRDQDENGQPIDATGELPDGSRFSNPHELKQMIAGRLPDFSRNLVEKLLAYALCRRLEGYDEIVVDQLMRDIAADDYRMQTLVTSVITSYPFTHRRIE